MFPPLAPAPPPPESAGFPAARADESPAPPSSSRSRGAASGNASTSPAAPLNAATISSSASSAAFRYAGFFRAHSATTALTTRSAPPPGTSAAASGALATIAATALGNASFPSQTRPGSSSRSPASAAGTFGATTSGAAFAAAASASAPWRFTAYRADCLYLRSHAAQISSRYNRSVALWLAAFSSHTSSHRFLHAAFSSWRPTKASGKTAAAWFASWSEAFRESSSARCAARRRFFSLSSAASWSSPSYISHTSVTSWFTRASVACRATAATAETIADATAALRSLLAAPSSALNSFPACGFTRLPRRKHRREMNRPAPARVFRPTPLRRTDASEGTSSFIVSSSTWFMSTSRVSPIGDAFADCSRACSSLSWDNPMALACCSM